MITMLLGGLWHGAGWTFVLWGGLHGADADGRALGSATASPGIPIVQKWLALA